MSNPPTKATANTLGAVAKSYKVDLRTLLNWFNAHPALLEKIKPYRDGKTLVYPPALIQEILDTLGEP